MKILQSDSYLIQGPLAWAADSRACANCEHDPEAKAAFEQVADEFEAASAEIEGLVDTFKALVTRKRSVEASASQKVIRMPVNA